jgi:putative restriction endonuclease
LVCVGPEAADNRWLREAFENRVPIIYFLGIAPGGYQAILPTFICGWDDKALKACVAFGAPDQLTLAPRVSRTASARGSGKKVIERIK